MCGENRSDQWARAGDCGEMMSEQNPFVRRIIIFTVVERVRGRDACGVERDDFGRQERAVITVGNRQNAQCAEHERKSGHLEADISNWDFKFTLLSRRKNIFRKV